MKKTLIFLITSLFTVGVLHAQWPSNVTTVESKSNDSVIVSGDLAKGVLMEDLSWAANSSNACFPATQNLKFRGNHVLYATSIPPRSILTISVTPTDANGDLSIYGYMMGNNEYRVVPNLPSCISCEADHKWDRPWKGKVQTSERKIEFQNPTQNTYNIVIGVAAPKDVITGQFNLKIKLKS
ncbi:MAG: hypothetical protein IPF69_12090 [Chitinophagaceae bacterium]|nr:hypothetical protein [Chitinophagaceae bacterium]MBK7679724.1 hypothetical protein [Chitinophagaceae bacterium]MBK8298923.1 hypothetical protein [Chitinophagaceae bacterium]MBK9464745.1 hypothetical protein [Chitinophagaceae bacterium]MBK9659896.1 hypothetical protein [Chitinophagaceae bacterium]